MDSLNRRIFMPWLSRQIILHPTIKVSALLVIASVLLFLNLRTYGIWLTPDSLNYLEVAKNLVMGQGLVLGDYALTPTAPTPLTAWTPLYPIVLSWFIHGEGGLLQQAIYPALLLYTGSGLLLFLILKHFTNVTWALLGCGIWLISVPAWTVYHYAWSESLFITLALLQIWLLVLWFDSPINKGRAYSYLIIATSTVVLTALFYTRYLGISFLPLLTLPLIFSKSKNTYKFLWLASTACYISLISGWLWRNNSLTGTFSGAVRSPSTVSLLDNISNVVNAYSIMFPSHIISHLLSGLLTTFIILRLRNKTTPIPAQGSSLLGIVTVIISMASYLAALILLRTWQEFDSIDIRLISPSVPFFICGLVIFGFSCFRQSSTSATVGLFLVIWILSTIGIEGGRVYIDSRIQVSNHKNFLFQESPSQFYNNFSALAHDDLLFHIISRLDKNNQAIFVVEQAKIAAIIHISLGKKAKLLPTTIDDVSVKKLNQLGHGFLILTEPQGLQQYYQQYFNQLSIHPEYLDEGFLVVDLPLPTIPK